LKVFLSVY